KELKDRENSIKNCKKESSSLNSQNIAHQQTISQLTLSKKYLETINNTLDLKKQELTEKRKYHDEYKLLLDKFIVELEDIDKEIEEINKDLQKSFINAAKVIE